MLEAQADLSRPHRFYVVVMIYSYYRVAVILDTERDIHIYLTIFAFVK